MPKQVAFITGAASGIGKQIGETLLKEGKTVVFSDIDEDALKEVVDGIHRTELRRRFNRL